MYETVNFVKLKKLARHLEVCFWHRSDFFVHFRTYPNHPGAVEN